MLRHVTPLTHKGLIFAPTFVLDFCQGQAVVFAGVKIDGKILEFWHCLIQMRLKGHGGHMGA
jgi:hypothetical protein